MTHALFWLTALLTIAALEIASVQMLTAQGGLAVAAAAGRVGL